MKPWFRNVAGAIRKTPKWHLRDWSRVDCFAADRPVVVPARTFLSQLP